MCPAPRPPASISVRKHGLLWVLLWAALPAVAQNLVPNPDFSLFATCPPYLGQIHEAIGWDSPNFATSDYFHRCVDSAQGNGIPANRLGWQEPYAGTGYAGIRLWLPPGTSTPDQREYLTTRLSAPLEADSLYRVRCYASLADFATHSTDALGIGLAAQPFGTTRLISFVPAARQPVGSPLLDRMGWTLVERTYRAHGGEQYLIIGNFLPDTAMLLVATAPPAGATAVLAAYVFVDAVSVERIPDCPAYPDLLPPDTLLCPGASLILRSPLTGASHRWSTGDTTPEVSVREAGWIAVEVQRGACRWRDSLLIGYLAGPLPARTSIDTLLCEGESWPFGAPAGAMAYRWDDGAVVGDRVLDAAGLYTLHSFFSCDTLRQTLRVAVQPCDCAFFPQNVFSPNGDGINDMFDPDLSPGVVVEQWSICDRWGRCLLTRSDLPLRWDGQLGDRPAPAGWYVWTLRYTCLAGGQRETRQVHGSISLLR
ncbi:MAG: hypothetical protein OHK0039_35330 [Bacteroidia bacterium]